MKPGFYFYITVVAFFLLSFTVRSRAQTSVITDSEAAMQALFQQSHLLMVVNANGQAVSANYQYQSMHQNSNRPAVTLSGVFANVIRTLIDKSDIEIVNYCSPRDVNSEVICSLSITYVNQLGDIDTPKQVLISYNAQIVDGMKDTKIVRLRPEIMMEVRR